MSQHRIVVLKDINSDRYLPIWIGPFVAEAITVELQEVPSPRPLTHDLLKSVIQELGGEVVQVLVNDLRNEVYYARLVVNINGKQVEIDSRPSDAIALAVRVKAPIFVAESVMEHAIQPDEDVEFDAAGEGSEESGVDDTKLSAFADFVDTLDLDDLEDSDN